MIFSKTRPSFLGSQIENLVGFDFIFFVDVIETIGEIIDERMINQNNCNCSLAKTKTGSLFSYNFSPNSKTFDPVKVDKLNSFSELDLINNAPLLKEVNRFKEKELKKHEARRSSLEKHSSTIRKEQIEKAFIIVVISLLICAVIFLFIVRNFETVIFPMSFADGKMSH